HPQREAHRIHRPYQGTYTSGDLQRLRLATQLRSGLFGVVYVLDEPSAGLHPADTEALVSVRTPRSNPATYTGLFDTVRKLFAGTETARARGYDAGRFSFNVTGGRCETCQGEGYVTVELLFLPSTYSPCPD